MDLQIIIAVELALILLALMGSKEKEDPSVAQWRYKLEKHLESIDGNLQMAEQSLHAIRDSYKERGGY